MNSCGEDFADHVKFSVKKSSVLGFTYYVIFWSLKNLTQGVTIKYNKKNFGTSELIDKLFMKLPKTLFNCPNCNKKTKVKCIYECCT